MVVEKGDVVLVTHREKAQDIKSIEVLLDRVGALEIDPSLGEDDIVRFEDRYGRSDNAHVRSRR